MILVIASHNKSDNSKTHGLTGRLVHAFFVYCADINYHYYSIDYIFQSFELIFHYGVLLWSLFHVAQRLLVIPHIKQRVLGIAFGYKVRIVLRVDVDDRLY